MLEIRNLSFAYSKNAPLVLDNLNLTLGDGEIGIVLGKNGSGKTTLFTNILGINRPFSGTMLFNGKQLEKMNVRERATQIAYVPQHIHFGSLSVYDSVLLGRISYFGLKPGKNDHAVVEKILEEMQLSDFAFRNAEQLSGGEKQKVAIARALAQEPKLLIFDEPTGNLDISNEELIIREAKKVAREKGIGILSSLHDLNQAMWFGDKFFFVKKGKVICSGGEEVFTKEIIRDVFDINADIIEHKGKKIILGGSYYENK